MEKVYFAKGSTLPEQFFDIGRINSLYIKEAVLKNRRKRSEKYKNRKSLLNRIYLRLQNIDIARDFINCLTSWSEGAGITAFEAFELLDDNAGCQTLIARYANGIALLHTEEELDDINARMTEPKVICFKNENDSKYALVYNNLLPGAGVFGWSKDFAMAVDSLFLRDDGLDSIERPMLANVVSWIVWNCKGEQLEKTKMINIISDLGSCIDGYAINILRNTHNLPEAYKVTFSRDAIETEDLGGKQGSFLKQINLVEPEYVKAGKPIAEWVMPYRRFYRGYWTYYKDRMNKLNKDIESYSHLGGKIVTDRKKTQELIINEITGKLAGNYINEVVGALCVVLMSKDDLDVAVGIVSNSRLEEVRYF